MIRIIFTAIGLFILTHSYAQDLIIVYENDDAFNTIAQNPLIKQEYQKYLNKTITEDDEYRGSARTTLRLGQRLGIYTLDSVYIKKVEENSRFFRESELHLRDYNQDLRLIIKPSHPEHYAQQETCRELLDWQIDKSKTKNILGMTCYYATATEKTGYKSHHQIWFTEELPYTDGPFRSQDAYGCNLPGLVLEHIMGDGYTTTAVDIHFASFSKGLEDKLASLSTNPKTKQAFVKPSGGREDGLLIIDADIKTNTWVPLHYTKDHLKQWLEY